MDFSYPEIGICGLSCRLCPRYQTDAASRCLGCKSPDRLSLGCPFITCAVKKKGLEFCQDCAENLTCAKWRQHREAGKQYDSFKCYQTLDEDIAFMQQHGAAEFDQTQQTREQLLRTMLLEFNDGRSKSYFCIAATVLDLAELSGALASARQMAIGLTVQEKSKLLHGKLDELATRKGVCLRLRK